MRGRIVIALAIVVVAGCGESTLTQSQSGYFIELPSEAKSPGSDATGGAIIAMTTNLPTGILVRVEYEYLGGGGVAGGRCCPAFLERSLAYHVEGDCLRPDEASSRFRFKVIAAPRPDGGVCRSFAGCASPQPQPQNVQGELGSDFQRLEGDQVTTWNGMRALVVSKEYAWPQDACNGPMSELMPDRCPESTASINDDEGGEKVQKVGGSVVGTLAQYRLCELYNYATEDFQKENAWLEFRDRTRAWVDAHRPLAGPDFGEFYLTHKIVRTSGRRLGGEFNSPSWIEVDYVLRGERVGHARFVARLWYSGYTKWDMDELVLL